MSVVVRDMRMPKDCRECPFESYSINTGQTVCLANMRVMAINGKPIAFDGRPKWCPLFEVKAWEEI